MRALHGLLRRHSRLAGDEIAQRHQHPEPPRLRVRPTVHDIALQRTIGMGILLVVTPTQAEEASAAALSSSWTSADIALHRTMVIICVVLLVGLRVFAFYSPPVY
jgi:hypothetical protein